jgi:serine/threonine-protein kinase
MECLDEHTLLDFLAGRLDGAATARAREHVARCETCNAIATDVIRGAASQLRSTPVRAKSYELAPGAVIAEKYRLVRALGEGGMGVVWEAEALDRDGGGCDGPRVAIKLLKAFDAAAKKRFVREIAMTSALAHPGLVRVVDVIEDVEAGCPALVMELLAGMPLAARLREERRLDPREARLVARELARTLAAVHGAGFVHRDIKPANVYLPSDRARPVVLLDLGLAKAMSGAGAPMTPVTRTGHAVGTPAYMAPEQLAGEASIDGRADLWSLGVVLYECTTGERPFAGHTAAEILRAVLRGPPPPADGVDPPTTAVLRSLLHPDRAARPASADLVVDALARIDPDG